MGVYFSKRDTRVWVPKRVPAFGWTLNLGQPQAAWWLVGIMLAPLVLCALARKRRSEH